MQAIWGFVKRTLIGGLLVLLPLYLAVIVLAKGLQGLTALMAPLVKVMPIEREHHTIAAVVAVIVLSFLVGLALTTGPGRRLGNTMNTKVLDRIPGYSVFRNIIGRGFGDESAQFDVALVDFDDNSVIAYVVERHDDGRCTVFAPGSPTAFSGTVFVVDGARVRLLDASLVQTFQAMSKWGAGTRDLLVYREAAARQQP